MNERINQVCDVLLKRYKSFRSAQNAVSGKFSELRTKSYIVHTAYQYAYDKGRADATLDAIRELRKDRHEQEYKAE